MTMNFKGTLGICAGVAGAIFVGYCIYFDNKRRKDPNFKKKLREKRKRAAKPNVSGSNVEWPNIKDQEEVQEFFLSQVRTGEELLSVGDIEGGTEHLSRAVAVCGQAQQLLQVLQTSLPPQVFQLLLQKLPSAGESMLAARGGSKITEEDVE